METLEKKENRSLFSILICTFNGAVRLPSTLKHIAALQRDALMYTELLVVNNASNDQTDTVVMKTWEALGNPYPLRLLYMPDPGKSYALELGISKASGDYIIICDDDNWLMPDYLQVVSELMSTHNQVGILGGNATAVSDTPLPTWFADYQYAYACGSQMAEEGLTTGVKLLWGAGMVLRTTLAKKIFNPDLPLLLTCRKGEQLISGGDDEICLRCWLLGTNTYYTPRLQLQHYMPTARLTEIYRNQLIAGFAEQGPAISAYTRLYDLVKTNALNGNTTIKKIFAWFFYKLSANGQQKAHAADYIFFTTGWAFFKTPENERVRNFYLAQKRKEIIN